jgi:hypothetical protein
MTSYSDQLRLEPSYSHQPDAGIPKQAAGFIDIFHLPERTSYLLSYHGLLSIICFGFGGGCWSAEDGDFKLHQSFEFSVLSNHLY